MGWRNLQSRRAQLDHHREAIRNAQKITGKKVINGEDSRRGLETLNITEARLKETAEGFAALMKVA